MKKALMLALVFFSPWYVAQASEENPFLKPEFRKPPKPVHVDPDPLSLNSANESANSIDLSAEKEAESPVTDAKLIAIINGEEVWFKTEEKVYVRQKERNGSKLKLQEKESPESSEAQPIHH